jgi:hypothetical protein
MPVAILTLVVIFGQSISSIIGALISGQPLKQSSNGNDIGTNWRIFLYHRHTWNVTKCY